MDFTEIVFENRNKDYGAYKLRKKYAKYLLISFFITIFFILAFTVYTLAYKFYSFKPLSLPRGVVYQPSHISEEEITAPKLPEQKPEELPEPSPEKLNETPVVADSVPNTSKKEEEIEKEKENEEPQDSSAGGARQGVADGDITVPVQRMPQFPGGEEALAIFMRKNIRYSEFDKTRRVRGQVVISFVVKRDGSLDNIKIVKSLLPEIDKECLRVVAAMPLWRPAISGGRPIDVTHILPLTIAF